MTPFLIGLAGLSGAGKSTLAEHLERQGGVKRFRFDAFYKDEVDCPRVEGRPHWDLPQSVHLDAVFETLACLKRGEDVFIPIYNRRESRATGRVLYKAAPVIFAEGELLFADARIRELFDLRLWLEVPEQIAIKRRLERQPDYDLDFHYRIALPAMRTHASAFKPLAHASIDGTPSAFEVASVADRIVRTHMRV